MELRDPMPAPTSPPAKGGSFLTKKYGPLPAWAWAGLGVLGFYLWKQRQAAAAASAASTTPTTSTAATSPVAQAPSGYGYQGPGVGYGGSGPTPTGATAATSTGYTPPTGETEAPGSGGYGGVANVTSASGTNFAYLPSWQSAQALLGQGQTLYYQPTPGNFAPANQGNQLIPNIGTQTPLYVNQSASA